MAAKFVNRCKKSWAGDDHDVDDDGDKSTQSCTGGGSVTTQAPAASQRMKLLRRLNQNLKFF